MILIYYIQYKYIMKMYSNKKKKEYSFIDYELNCIFILIHR